MKMQQCRKPVREIRALPADVDPTPGFIWFSFHGETFYSRDEYIIYHFYSQIRDILKGNCV